MKNLKKIVALSLVFILCFLMVPVSSVEAASKKQFTVSGKTIKPVVKKGTDISKNLNAALKEAKYGWRRWYKDSENYGLNPDSFETQEEYREALDTKRKEARQQEQDERQKEQLLAEEKKRKEYENDATIYTYCGVLLPFSSHLYSFRTDDRTIQIGDTVIIPVGEEEKETEGRVVSVGQYTRLAVPYPVEKTKKIIRKAQKGAKS